MLTLADVEGAAERLSGHARRTRVVGHPALDDRAGAVVQLKLECEQETGSFKFRGAYNTVSVLDADQRAAGVVTYSSGNHGQGVARAAQLAGTTAVVVMPHDAPAHKVARTEAFGARLVRYDRYQEDRAAIAAGIAAEEGRAVVPPYDHYPVMAGQGTVALELLDQLSAPEAGVAARPGLGALLVPLGGGGLLAGCATVIAGRDPGVRVYGVEPEAGDDHRRSRRAGHRIDIGVPTTIADGQQVPTPGELTWPINDRLTTDFLTVTDEEIVATMGLLHEHLGLMVEPSGASAFAAVVHGRLPTSSSATAGTVAVVVSGGNIGPDRFRELTGLSI